MFTYLATAAVESHEVLACAPLTLLAVSAWHDDDQALARVALRRACHLDTSARLPLPGPPRNLWGGPSVFPRSARGPDARPCLGRGDAARAPGPPAVAACGAWRPLPHGCAHPSRAVPTRPAVHGCTAPCGSGTACWQCHLSSRCPAAPALCARTRPGPGCLPGQAQALLLPSDCRGLCHDCPAPYPPCLLTPRRRPPTAPVRSAPDWPAADRSAADRSALAVPPVGLVRSRKAHLRCAASWFKTPVTMRGSGGTACSRS
ncbi:hypothetical protein [Streptomyces peucetius]|uniref:hypothetical protein n=1 Tax=Streptomyces peucetius TaxID=1950 RepID=UPI003B839EAB